MQIMRVGQADHSCCEIDKGTTNNKARLKMEWLTQP